MFEIREFCQEHTMHTHTTLGPNLSTRESDKSMDRNECVQYASTMCSGSRWQGFLHTLRSICSEMYNFNAILNDICVTLCNLHTLDRRWPISFFLSFILGTCWRYLSDWFCVAVLKANLLHSIFSLSLFLLFYFNRFSSLDTFDCIELFATSTAVSTFHGFQFGKITVLSLAKD